MSILFGNNSRGQNKNMLEFKAGKMFMKGKMVHPDKRKGLVYIHQSDDSLMHFCWKDRTSGTVEDDFIIFPDDVEYKRVAQCTTGRVYVLKFKSTNRKCFFWMQEPKTDKDEENCGKVNEYLNNPPALGANRSGGREGDLQNLLSSMSQQQFMQLLGGMSGVTGMGNLSSLLAGNHVASLSSSASSNQSSKTSSASTPRQETPAAVTPASPSSRSNRIQLSDLRDILSGLNASATAETDLEPPVASSGGTGGGSDGAAAAAAAAKPSVDLSVAMTSETLQPLLASPEFINRLQAFLPAETDEALTSASLAEQLRGTLQSPQFQQAMNMFSAALQSGQLGPLMQQFGLGEDVVSAASQGDVEAFVKALQESQKKDSETTEKTSGDKSKDDDDEEMALD